MNKRDLQRLEGLLLLILLNKTKSKRLSASVIGISVDTLTKYINFLENDIGAKLQEPHKNGCFLTSKANELITKLKNLDIENWTVRSNKINIFDIKNVRGIFYLKAISFYRNKRNASQKLATSIETINLYIDYLQNALQVPLLYSDSHGTFLTDEGTAIIIKFDRINSFIKYIISQKATHNNNIRLALEKGINLSVNSLNEASSQDIIVFTDNPDLHTDEWDIAISFSKPHEKCLIIPYTRKIHCGFFASSEYMTNFGTPRDIDDVKNNHLVLDGRNQSYANENYCDFIDDCKKTKFIKNPNIALLDMVEYGAGICLIPLIIPKSNLVYLEHIPCNVEATLYLSIHKSFNNIPKYRQAIAHYQEMLELI